MPEIRLGGGMDMADIRIGSTQVEEVRLGAELIWQSVFAQYSGPALVPQGGSVQVNQFTSNFPIVSIDDVTYGPNLGADQVLNISRGSFVRDGGGGGVSGTSTECDVLSPARNTIPAGNSYTAAGSSCFTVTTFNPYTGHTPYTVTEVSPAEPTPADIMRTFVVRGGDGEVVNVVVPQPGAAGNDVTVNVPGLGQRGVGVYQGSPFTEPRPSSGRVPTSNQSVTTTGTGATFTISGGELRSSSPNYYESTIAFVNGITSNYTGVNYSIPQSTLSWSASDASGAGVLTPSGDQVRWTTGPWGVNDGTVEAEVRGRITVGGNTYLSNNSIPLGPVNVNVVPAGVAERTFSADTSTRRFELGQTTSFTISYTTNTDIQASLTGVGGVPEGNYGDWSMNFNGQGTRTSGRSSTHPGNGSVTVTLPSSAGIVRTRELSFYAGSSSTRLGVITLEAFRPSISAPATLTLPGQTISVLTSNAGTIQTVTPITITAPLAITGGNGVASINPGDFGAYRTAGGAFGMSSFTYTWNNGILSLMARNGSPGLLSTTLPNTNDSAVFSNTVTITGNDGTTTNVVVSVTITRID